MNRKPDPILLERIEKCDWLAATGQRFICPDGLTCRPANSWASACALADEQMWEDTELEARNELTRYLHNTFRSEYRHWNEITDWVRPFVDERASLRFRMAARRKFGEVPKVVVDAMKWDVLAAIMEHTYKDLQPPSFFTKLLVLYEAGHFPCGWENGIYPEGRLVVF